jgi:hypothetical protein
MPSVTRKKSTRRATPYTMATCVVRLTYDVKAHIVSKAKWGESIDQTLRRMFSMGKWDGKEKPRDGK